jgi:hypothetical protein
LPRRVIEDVVAKLPADIHGTVQGAVRDVSLDHAHLRRVG